MTTALWSIVHDSDFAEFANVSPSPAPGAIGDGWIDTLGNTWGITSGLAVSGNLDASGYLLARPTAENAADAMMRVFLNAGELANTKNIVLVLRWQSSTTYYYTSVTTTHIGVTRMVSNATTTILLTSYVVPTTTPIYIEFSIKGAAVTLAVKNTSDDSTVVSTTATDTSPITAAGKLAIDGATNPGIARATTLVPVTTGLQISDTVNTAVIYAGDVGSTLFVTVDDDAGSPVDLSGATSLQLLLQAPNATISAVTPSLVNTGADGKLFYIFTSTDITVGSDGVWQYQVKYVISGITKHTNVKTFTVQRSME